MIAILRKEIQSFFTSPIGYLIIGLFLLLNGLFLWVFKGDFNIFDYGFADLGNFFLLAPWVFLFLIPAVAMKSFAEERKIGTLELLSIKPISTWKLILGKFYGTFLLCILAVFPTICYVFAISALGTTPGNFDLGVVMGSYFGLLFLMAAYAAIGLFASVISDNQIMAFILGVFFCFFIFYGFEALSTVFSQGTVQVTIQSIGAKTHFESVALGILDTRDIIYFASICTFFLYLTHGRLKPVK
ncbi:MAG: gliding motility-associated ABC transporter permease subunit GldF [Bacteroidota bacterium]